MVRQKPESAGSEAGAEGIGAVKMGCGLRVKLGLIPDIQ